MNNGPSSAERISSRARRCADQNTVTDSLRQEVVIDVHINDGQVRLTATMQEQLVDGVKGGRDLDGRLPTGDA